jgi:membrane associated rhomboid family serine protease
MAWHSTWNKDSQPPREGGGFFVDRGGMFPPAVKLILFATVGVFILQMLGYDQILSAYGSLSVRDLLHLEVWRLVTYMFLHASGNHILINMLVLVMLGSYLERQIGARSFLSLYFACGIAGGLCESLFNWIMFLMHGGDMHFLGMPAVGASAGVMGVLVGFATLNPREKLPVFFILPVEAWWVAAIYGIFETWPLLAALVTGNVPRGDNVAHAAHFGGMVVAFLWIKWGFHIADFVRGLMVTDRPAFVNRDPQAETQEENRILDKIHAQGIDSLTTSEKMFLQEMSRKRRRS